MTGKTAILAQMMEQVAQCRLCCGEDPCIKPHKLLHNFIAERPDGPRYGNVPNIWTDWHDRLHAKIAIVGQDWGAEGGPIGTTALRREYEERVRQGGHPDQVWSDMRSRNLDRGTPNMIRYLTDSAVREGLPPTPQNLLDDVFLTNPLLCVRHGEEASGEKNLDRRRSTGHCRRFLIRQLQIVRPAVVITWGRPALWSLGQIEWSGENLEEKLQAVHDPVKNPRGYIAANIDDLELRIVPVFHPAWPTNRDGEKNREDYRYVWRALRDGLACDGEDLMRLCFPNTWKNG